CSTVMWAYAVCLGALPDSLICNSCSASLFGFCINAQDVTCSTNTSVCFTSTASKFDLSECFIQQGCTEPAGCNITVNITLVGTTLSNTTECCSTDRCNPVNLSGATSIKMSLTAAISAAILASVWGSMLQ
uniref:Activin types I and II receptor domain-containing protein n=1 Tax=Salarias fasciatus TaxID=181472 RepID=A0A672ILH2_SALFA